MSSAQDRIDEFKTSFDNYGDKMFDVKKQFATNVAVGFSLGVLAGILGAKDNKVATMGLAGAGAAGGVGVSYAMDNDVFEIVAGNKTFCQKSLDDMHKDLDVIIVDYNKTN